MPLHLLGKKSWNVYNPANIARVRADEEAARAAEEAAEQRMQERDSARRMAILRGEEPPPLSDEEEEGKKDGHDSKRSGRRRRGSNDDGDAGAEGELDTRPRKKPRKRHGEDDTDFEMRLVRERAELAAAARERLGGGGGASSADVAIVDAKGHIDLFGGVGGAADSRAGTETQLVDGKGRGREAAQEEEATTEGMGMRFLDAAGRGQAGTLTGAATPWYASSKKRPRGDGQEDEFEALTMDVWGRDDPGRKARAVARVAADDPLAFMKSGARQAREVAKERRREEDERTRVLEEMRREERRREKKDKKRRRREVVGEDGGRGKMEWDGEYSGVPGSDRTRADERSRRRDEKDHRRRDRSKERRRSRSPRRDRHRSSSRRRHHHSHRKHDSTRQDEVR